MAADCLFTDQADRLLVLEPPYKPTWDIAGGVVEGDESPRLAAQREVREELGLTVEPGELLAVDWQSRSGDFTEMVAFLFDGGVLAAAEIDQILIEPSEVRSIRFVTLDEAKLAAEVSSDTACWRVLTPPGTCRCRGCWFASTPLPRPTGVRLSAAL
jgi:8-oxo-dGTP pyrophosphatase MutT (NUDIX family)